MKPILEAMSDLVAALAVLDGNANDEGIALVGSLPDNEIATVWGRIEDDEICLDVEVGPRKAYIGVKLADIELGEVEFTGEHWDRFDAGDGFPTWDQVGGVR